MTGDTLNQSRGPRGSAASAGGPCNADNARRRLLRGAGGRLGALCSFGALSLLKGLTPLLCLSIPILPLVLAGCATSSPTSPPSSRPAWVARPKGNDSYFMYRVGRATGHATEDAAKNAAYQDALASISREILSEVKVSDGTSSLTSGFTLQYAEVMPECIYFERDRAIYSCWVQISYPLTEKGKLLEQIAARASIETRWREAQTLVAKGDRAAEPLLNAILIDYGRAQPAPSFTPAAVQLALGDLSRANRDIAEACSCYEVVAKTATDPGLRDKAVRYLTELERQLPRLARVARRWGGRKVALLCAIRDGGSCRPFPDLTRILTQDCREAKLDAADLAGDLTPDQIAAVFDRDDAAFVCRTAARQYQARALLAVLCDIDPAKRGRTADAFGQTVPVPDTQVRFAVLLPESGKALYSGQFKELSGNGAESGWAARAATILIQKYLEPKCPAVGE